jgi:hypothetical protein
MQKAHSNLNISADKDKLKEPKTPTVPVTDPKKAPIVRDADQKAFERLKTIKKASAVALLVASCLWYYGMPPSSRTVTGVERYTPANPGLNKQHSASPPGHAMLPPVVPVPIYPNDVNNKDKIVQSKSIDRDFKDSRYSIKQDLEVQSPAFNLFIGDELNEKNHPQIDISMLNGLDCDFNALPTCILPNVIQHYLLMMILFIFTYYFVFIGR